MFCCDHGFSLFHLSNYYPQGNEQVESSNKNLIAIMRKLVSENYMDWHKILYEALWANRTSPKRAIGMTPFKLVYGIGAQLSLPLELSASKLEKVIEDQYFQDSLEKRVIYLTKVDEEISEMVDHITTHQAHVKNILNRKAKPRKFLQGDQVLLWDRRREPKGAHNKFDSLWKGPFKIHRVLGPNSFKLEYPDGKIMPILLWAGS